MTLQPPAARRSISRTELLVSPVGFGCWPIAGVSSLNVTKANSVATLLEARRLGINFFDTAFSYGYDGEADRLLREAFDLKNDPDIVIASKVGSHYNAERQRIVDGSPERIHFETRQILRRLDLEAIPILYLHQPDPCVDLASSAGAIAELIQAGLVRYAGVSNVNLQQLQLFHNVCPVVIVQPPFNMLQQESVIEIRDFCAVNQISIAAYWVLMKGLLAGRMQRDHRFEPQDRRLTYAVYQGEAWGRAQDLLDILREISADIGASVAQIVIAWTLRQPGLTVGLCGAKHPEQIAETAAAMQVELSAEKIDLIDVAISKLIVSRSQES